MEHSRDTTSNASYDDDFVTWTKCQASLLRAGRYDLIDVANVAEEIESLGKSQLAALRACYRLIAMHLLKLLHQPERATASWENTINRERGNAADLLDDNPGMKPRRAELFRKAYAAARSEAAFETRLAIELFPEEPPLTVDQVEDIAFWPPGFPLRQVPESRA